MASSVGPPLAVGFAPSPEAIHCLNLETPQASDDHVGAVQSGHNGTALLDTKTGGPSRLNDAVLVDAVQRVFPLDPILETERLTGETLYWYSHHNKRPLPVLKVRFGDPSSTWLFLDPATGEIAGSSDRSARIYRWLLNFLHDYDLPILLRNQPARDFSCGFYPSRAWSSQCQAW